MLISPPKDADAAEVFRSFLSRTIVRPIGRILPEIEVEAFVRAIGSYDWTRLHRAIVQSSGADRVRAEHELIAFVVADAEGRVLLEPNDLDALYRPERERLVRAASDALVEISPTFVSHNIDEWIRFLEIGASAGENLADTFSLGQCRTTAFGFGKGAIAIRHEPELYFDVPRRALVDAQWLAYYAAANVYQRSR